MYGRSHMNFNPDTLAGGVGVGGGGGGMSRLVRGVAISVAQNSG